MSKTELSKFRPSPAAPGTSMRRELDRGEAEHEARLLDQRERAGVVEDRGQVAHAPDQRALGELADRAVAVGPVVRVLGGGRAATGRAPPAGLLSIDSDLFVTFSLRASGPEIVGGMGRPFNSDAGDGGPGGGGGGGVERGVGGAKLVGSVSGDP